MGQLHQTITILIVGEHPLIRLGLVSILKREPGFIVCGELENLQEAIQKIHTMQPNVLVHAVGMDGIGSLQSIKTLKSQYHDLQILVLSEHKEAIYIERFMRAGAQGYIVETQAMEQLISAIYVVLGGERYLSNSLTIGILNHFLEPGKVIINSPLDYLSDRELEVFQLVGKGCSTQEITKKLYLSPHTVETYRARIKKKLKITHGSALIQVATEWTLKNGTTREIRRKKKI